MVAEAPGIGNPAAAQGGFTRLGFRGLMAAMRALHTVVIPAAGLGTRMRPVDPGLPKELLAVAGRPLICRALDEALLAGASKAVVVIRPGKEDLRRLVEDSSWARGRWPEAHAGLERARQALEFHFPVQASPRGEADALLLAEDLVAGRPFGVVYPDNVAHPPGALAEACRMLAATGLDSVALMRVDPDMAGRLAHSGRVDLARTSHSPQDSGWRVRAFLPKGPGPFRPRFAGEMRTCGMFAALPHWFAFTRRADAPGLEGELTDGKVRRVMLAAGVSFAGAPVPGTVHDCGTPEGYAACIRDVAGPA